MDELMTNENQIMPTEPGVYRGLRGGVWELIKNEGWFNNGQQRGLGVVRNYAPFTLLRDEKEVATEILANVLHQYETSSRNHRDIILLVAAEYGVNL
jgi:hypothetical protein